MWLSYHFFHSNSQIEIENRKQNPGKCGSPAKTVLFTLFHAEKKEKKTKKQNLHLEKETIPRKSWIACQNFFSLKLKNK